MKNILLLQPMAYSKYPGMPMGIIHTASALENKYKVSVYDFNATPYDKKSLFNLLSVQNPDVVMIGGTSPSQPEAYEIARLVKQYDKGIIVIKGGPNELFYPHQTAKNKFIDFVLSGDGESAAILLQKIKLNKQEEDVFIGHVELNNTPLPSRKLLYDRNQKYYDFLGYSTAQARTNRGCTFHCNYCSQGIYREYSLEYIQSDIERIHKEGFKAIYWDDAVFTLRKNRLNKIIEFLNNYKFEMGCITRAGVNTEIELFERMSNIGFRYIWFALESGDRNIRRSLGRDGTGPKVVKNAVDKAKSAGLIPFVNIIIGCEGESDETIISTIKALNYIKPYGVSTSVYTIYPGMKGCDENTYEKPINRDKRLMHFDEGYGGKILIEPGLAQEWYFKITDEIRKNGIKMLSFNDCRTPNIWKLPKEA